MFDDDNVSGVESEDILKLSGGGKNFFVLPPEILRIPL
jgi:hypothetical protein